MTEAGIQELIKKQRDFFYTGAPLEVSNRIKALKNLKEAIYYYEEEIFESLKKDLNKPLLEAFFSEILTVVKEINTMIKKVKKWSKGHRVKTSIISFPSKGYILPEPYGVSLIISPWNYPVQLVLAPLAGALCAGNTAILKLSEHSVHTGTVVEKIIKRAFNEEYVAVVQGGVNETTLLLKEKTDFIFFTGSTQVGKIVMKAAAEHLTPVVLELGGKSPCIIDETADMKLSVKRIAWGKNINAGQTCIAPDYIFIQKERKEEFIQCYRETISQFYSDTQDYCSIINENHFDRLTGMMEEARILFGGRTRRDSLYIEPTLTESHAFTQRLHEEEIFGPILHIMTYDDITEIPGFVRSTGKPLALYIFSKSKQNINYILKNTSSGGVCINDTITHVTEESLPFGGVAESGLGSYHGHHSFEAFSHLRSVLKKGKWDLPMKFPPYSNEKWHKRMKKLL